MESTPVGSRTSRSKEMTFEDLGTLINSNSSILILQAIIQKEAAKYARSLAKSNDR